MTLHQQAADDAATYEPPTVVEYGTLQEVTAGAGTPASLDATFPTGTPFADLTFTT